MPLLLTGPLLFNEENHATALLLPRRHHSYSSKQSTNESLPRQSLQALSFVFFAAPPASHQRSAHPALIACQNDSDVEEDACSGWSWHLLYYAAERRLTWELRNTKNDQPSASAAQRSHAVDKDSSTYVLHANEVDTYAHQLVTLVFDCTTGVACLCLNTQFRCKIQLPMERLYTNDVFASTPLHLGATPTASGSGSAKTSIATTTESFVGLISQVNWSRYGDEKELQMSMEKELKDVSSSDALQLTHGGNIPSTESSAAIEQHVSHVSLEEMIRHHRLPCPPPSRAEPFYTLEQLRCWCPGQDPLHACQTSSNNCSNNMERNDDASATPSSNVASSNAPPIPRINCSTRRPVPLRRRVGKPPRLRLLHCHDFRGGYTEEDSNCQEGFERFHAYCFTFWSHIDIFVYFSHARIAVPPTVWIDAAHKEGVKVLGNVCMEWEEGEKEVIRLLDEAPWDTTGTTTSASPPHTRATTTPATLPPLTGWQQYAHKLVALALEYGFDGWFINIESKLPNGLNTSSTSADEAQLHQRNTSHSNASQSSSQSNNYVVRLVSFLSYLRMLLRSVLPHGEVIWYDSVVASDGGLRWQSELNEENACFARAAGNMLVDYHWDEMAPTRSRVYAEQYKPPPFVIEALGEAEEQVAKERAAGGLDALLHLAAKSDLTLSPSIAHAACQSNASTAASIDSSISPSSIYTGIDVWGRGTWGGGRFNTPAALRVIADAGTSVALFAPAWTYEPRNGCSSISRHAFLQAERRLWIGEEMETEISIPCGTALCKDIAVALKSWTISEQGGDGWGVTTRDEDHRSAGSESGKNESQRLCFVTSHKMCRRRQCIDLLAAATIEPDDSGQANNGAPHIDSKRLALSSYPTLRIETEYAATPPTLADPYELHVRLLDEHGRMLDELRVATVATKKEWTTLTHTFHLTPDHAHLHDDNDEESIGLPPSQMVAFVEWEDGGCDAEHWAGHYGARIGSCRLFLQPSPTSTNTTTIDAEVSCAVVPNSNRRMDCVATYVPKRLLSFQSLLPFVHSFNTGNGKHFYIDGKRVDGRARNHSGRKPSTTPIEEDDEKDATCPWFHLGLQDVQSVLHDSLLGTGAYQHATLHCEHRDAVPLPGSSTKPNCCCSSHLVQAHAHIQHDSVAYDAGSCLEIALNMRSIHAEAPTKSEQKVVNDADAALPHSNPISTRTLHFDCFEFGVDEPEQNDDDNHVKQDPNTPHGLEVSFVVWGVTDSITPRLVLEFACASPSTPLRSTTTSATRAPFSSSSSSASSSSSNTVDGAEGKAQRRGGVGAGLATESWWDQYYRQQHDTYWDWYLPNEIAMEYIMECATVLCNERAAPSSSQQCVSTDVNSDDDATTPLSPPSPPPPPSSLASLSCLQLGCGSSSITRDLWEAGFRCVENVDFSSACIEHMKRVQMECGWEHDGRFTFRTMDVRQLEYPDQSFQLVLGKGTLDCVVLESSDSEASARRMLREVHRVLKPGGRYICFSLYPPSARARFWIQVPSMEASAGALTEEELAYEAAEIEDLCDVMQADNPPMRIQTPAWSELRMIALDCSPLELPNQKHTYIYIATKRVSTISTPAVSSSSLNSIQARSPNPASTTTEIHLPSTSSQADQTNDPFALHVDPSGTATTVSDAGNGWRCYTRRLPSHLIAGRQLRKIGVELQLRCDCHCHGNVQQHEADSNSALASRQCPTPSSDHASIRIGQVRIRQVTDGGSEMENNTDSNASSNLPQLPPVHSLFLSTPYTGIYQRYFTLTSLQSNSPCVSFMFSWCMHMPTPAGTATGAGSDSSGRNDESSASTPSVRYFEVYLNGHWQARVPRPYYFLENYKARQLKVEVTQNGSDSDQHSYQCPSSPLATQSRDVDPTSGSGSGSVSVSGNPSVPVSASASMPVTCTAVAHSRDVSPMHQSALHPHTFTFGVRAVFDDGLSQPLSTLHESTIRVRD